MSTTKRRLPISPVNIVLVSVSLVSAGVAALTANWWGTVVLAFIGFAVLIGALWARNPNASDRARVGSFEFADERDRAAGQSAFAAVGVAAMGLFFIEFIVVVLGQFAYSWVISVQVLVFLTAWGIGIRRGLNDPEYRSSDGDVYN